MGWLGRQRAVSVPPHKGNKNGCGNENQQDDGDYQQHFKLAFLEGEYGRGGPVPLGGEKEWQLSGAANGPGAFWAQ